MIIQNGKLVINKRIRNLSNCYPQYLRYSTNHILRHLKKTINSPNFNTFSNIMSIIHSPRRKSSRKFNWNAITSIPHIEQESYIGKERIIRENENQTHLWRLWLSVKVMISMQRLHLELEVMFFFNLAGANLQVNQRCDAQKYDFPFLNHNQTHR